MKVTGFHIEPTNICVLKCEGCARTRFIKQWPSRWKNHVLSVQDLEKFLDLDLKGLHITLCGNYGDPIYHPDLVRMVQYFKNQGSKITLVTNGSYRDRDWWTELCDTMDSNDRVKFSIDGLPENFTAYRKNADWQSILKGIETCVEKNIHTIWKYIPFSFNQDQIDLAKQLSLDLGIHEFLLDPSERYDSITQHLIPSDDLLGPRLASQQKFKNHSPIEVKPRCAGGEDHYISADGYFSPCCFVADHRFYYKTEFGRNKNSYSILDRTFSQIIGSQQTLRFFENIPESPPAVCQFNCPKL